ncbi:unnamed protein product [Amoebophrya sp. A120]|nr:unnamed protein product [Amoebophrya sp. A120]|eukprot:GSA120T00018224001.1
MSTIDPRYLRLSGAQLAHRHSTAEGKNEQIVYALWKDITSSLERSESHKTEAAALMAAIRYRVRGYPEKLPAILSKLVRFFSTNFEDVSDERFEMAADLVRAELPDARAGEIVFWVLRGILVDDATSVLCHIVALMEEELPNLPIVDKIQKALVLVHLYYNSSEVEEQQELQQTQYISAPVGEKQLQDMTFQQGYDFADYSNTLNSGTAMPSKGIKRPRAEGEAKPDEPEGEVRPLKNQGRRGGPGYYNEFDALRRDSSAYSSINSSISRSSGQPSRRSAQSVARVEPTEEYGVVNTFLGKMSSEGEGAEQSRMEAMRDSAVEQQAGGVEPQASMRGATDSAISISSAGSNSISIQGSVRKSSQMQSQAGVVPSRGSSSAVNYNTSISYGTGDYPRREEDNPTVVMQSRQDSSQIPRSTRENESTGFFLAPMTSSAGASSGGGRAAGASSTSASRTHSTFNESVKIPSRFDPKSSTSSSSTFRSSSSSNNSSMRDPSSSFSTGFAVPLATQTMSMAARGFNSSTSGRPTGPSSASRGGSSAVQRTKSFPIVDTNYRPRIPSESPRDHEPVDSNPMTAVQMSIKNIEKTVTNVVAAKAGEQQRPSEMFDQQGSTRALIANAERTVVNAQVTEPITSSDVAAPPLSAALAVPRANPSTASSVADPGSARGSNNPSRTEENSLLRMLNQQQQASKQSSAQRIAMERYGREGPSLAAPADAPVYPASAQNKLRPLTLRDMLDPTDAGNLTAAEKSRIRAYNPSRDAMGDVMQRPPPQTPEDISAKKRVPLLEVLAKVCDAEWKRTNPAAEESYLPHDSAVKDLSNLRKQILRAITSGSWENYGIVNAKFESIMHTDAIGAYKATQSQPVGQKLAMKYGETPQTLEMMAVQCATNPFVLQNASQYRVNRGEYLQDMGRVLSEIENEGRGSLFLAMAGEEGNETLVQQALKPYEMLQQNMATALGHNPSAPGTTGNATPRTRGNNSTEQVQASEYNFNNMDQNINNSSRSLTNSLSPREKEINVFLMSTNKHHAGADGTDPATLLSTPPNSRELKDPSFVLQMDDNGVTNFFDQVIVGPHEVITEGVNFNVKQTENLPFRQTVDYNPRNFSVAYQGAGAQTATKIIGANNSPRQPTRANNNNIPEAIPEQQEYESSNENNDKKNEEYILPPKNDNNLPPAGKKKTVSASVQSYTQNQRQDLLSKIPGGTTKNAQEGYSANQRDNLLSKMPF